MTDELKGPLGGAVRRGATWKVISQGTTQVSKMVVTVLVARLLTPHDFGVAAMVLVVAGFATALTDNALGPALVQRERLTQADKSTVLWLNLGMGAALAIAGIALAGPLARFYGEPQVQPLFIAVSIGFFVSCAGSTHMALLQRAMDFRRLELRQIGATVVGALTGITLALAHFGAWAIVGQQLAAAVTSTALLWLSVRWLPSIRGSFRSLRSLGGFAGFLFGENLVYQGSSNAGPLLIGRILGAGALGIYSLASNVILVPITRVVAPLAQVVFPAMARMSSDTERLTSAWLRASRLIAGLACPALVGLALVSPDFVPTVLGSKWSGAVGPVALLASAGAIQTFGALFPDLMLAVNRPGALFRVTILFSATSLAALVIGMQWGIIGVAASLVVASGVNEPAKMYLASRLLKVSLGRVLGAFVGVAAAVTAMVIAVLTIRMGLVEIGVPTVPRLLISILVGAATYLAVCTRYAPDVTEEIRHLVHSRRAAPTVPAASNETIAA